VLLYASQADPEGARRTLEGLVRTVPTARGFRAAAETLRILGQPAAAADLDRRAERLLAEPSAPAAGASRPGA
jgi:hypothetical protein